MFHLNLLLLLPFFLLLLFFFFFFFFCFSAAAAYCSVPSQFLTSSFSAFHPLRFCLFIPPPLAPPFHPSLGISGLSNIKGCDSCGCNLIKTLLLQ
ncbi:unnamed protein product [Schistocephalus solidus]|uniref:Secreted protein n=1 Tax=Schistocephalus solidus TaxID=70667 RepID=A0A183TMI4_SCHSO|nr:unnamed protein product [Schistocephalus solidus]